MKKKKMQQPKQLNETVRQVKGKDQVHKSKPRQKTGVFNDPQWYNAWVKPVLAMNPNRPTDPKYMQNISTVLTGLGLGYVVDTNVHFNDMRENMALDFATTQTFVRIRENLKSNLNYSSNKVKAYVLASLSAAIWIRTVERTLKWYPYFESTRPVLNQALKHYVPDGVKGFGNPIAIANAYDDLEYAYAKTRIKLVDSLASQLLIPDRIEKFIKHYIGSVFTDGDGNHAQLYRMNCTSTYLYKYNNSSDSIDIVEVNPMEGTVDQLVDYIQSIVSDYGVIIADLKRINAFSPVSQMDIESAPIGVKDPSFFNILINAYTHGFPESWDEVAGVDSKDRLRVDFMDGISDESFIDTALGLGALVSAYWFDADVNMDVHFMDVVNQGVIIEPGENSTITGGGFVATVPPGDGVVAPLEYLNNAALRYFAVTSDMTNTKDVSVVVPAYSDGSVTITSYIDNVFSDGGGEYIFYNAQLVGPNGSGTSFTVRYGEKIYPIFDVVESSTSQGYIGTSYLMGEIDDEHWGLFQAKVRVSPSGRDYTTSVQQVGTATFNVASKSSYYGYTTITGGWSSYVIDSTTLPYEPYFLAFTGMAPMVVHNKVLIPEALLTADISGAVDEGVVFTYTNSISVDMISWYIETVDYHLPIYYKDLMVIHGLAAESEAVLEVPSYQFLKECYKSTVLSVQDIAYTLYDMVMSLFTLNDFQAR